MIIKAYITFHNIRTAIEEICNKEAKETYREEEGGGLFINNIMGIDMNVKTKYLLWLQHSYRLPFINPFIKMKNNFCYLFTDATIRYHRVYADKIIKPIYSNNILKTIKSGIRYNAIATRRREYIGNTIRSPVDLEIIIAEVLFHTVYNNEYGFPLPRQARLEMKLGKTKNIYWFTRFERKVMCQEEKIKREKAKVREKTITSSDVWIQRLRQTVVEPIPSNIFAHVTLAGNTAPAE